MVKFTVKNYRCFSLNKPASIELRKGITAFVGPNNCGKSAFLKVFHEFSPSFFSLSSRKSSFSYVDHDNAKNEHENSVLSLGFNNQGRIELSGLKDVSDIESIFCDDNITTLSLIFEETQHSTDTPYLRSLEIRGDIRNRFNWSLVPCFAKTRQATAREDVDCTAIFTEIENLSKSMYIPPFRNAVNKGGANYFGLDIGDSFIKTWNSWKNGKEKRRNKIILEVTDQIRSLMGFSNLEINASEQGDNLKVSINGKPYNLDELGSGIAQLIFVLANAAIKRPPYIFIDEPELHLHPSLQMDFVTCLASYASEGTFFATHSIGLARSTADYIYSFQKKDGGIEVRPFEKTCEYLQFLGEMSFSSYQDLGCTHILLVEGITDIKTIQQFLRKLHIDHQVVILPLGGDGLATGDRYQEISEIKRISKNVWAIVDSEKTSKDCSEKRRASFEEVCKKLDIKVHVTERFAIENYFTDAAIRSVKGEKYKSLESYEKLGKEGSDWAKEENWKIARKMEWKDIEETDVGIFFKKLQQSVETEKGKASAV